MTATEFPNQELLEMMCHDGWLHEVMHHTGASYYEPEFIKRAGKGHENEIWVLYKDENMDEHISDGERFFGEASPGVFRFTVKDRR